MHTIPKLTTMIGALLLAPWSLTAQGSPPDSATFQVASTTLMNDLRHFVTAQEAFFVDHVTYARSLRQMQSRYRPSLGVTLVLLTASDSSHSEIAIIDKVPGLVCAMFVGDAPPPLGTGKEGMPTCRGP